MKSIFLISLIVSALIAAPYAAADDKTPAADGKTGKTATPSAKAAAKPAPSPALIDINSASKQDLIKGIGVNEAVADKIIAARPYGSKAQLVTRNVLPDGAYHAIKGLVIAKQPYSDAGKNAELQKKK